MNSTQPALRDHQSLVKRYLEGALEKDEALEKDYHVRSALQGLEIVEDDAQR